MYKYVGRSVIRSDEPKTLSIVEPLHCSSLLWRLCAHYKASNEDGDDQQTCSSRASTFHSGTILLTYGALPVLLGSA